MSYKNLIEIGLRSYLDTYFFNDEWVSESYLERLDIFIGQKSVNQKDILRRKFQTLTDHGRINDHFYELMIGAVFHPRGEFQDVSAGLSPDIIDNGVNIEVKNINAEPAEIERIKSLVPNEISYGPFPEDIDFDSRFKNKFLLQVNKAKRQIAGSGIIYIVWDTALKGFTERKPKIESLLNALCAEEKQQSPCIEIKTIDFQDLRKLVAKT